MNELTAARRPRGGDSPAPVSFASEELIQVDAGDRPIGYGSKAELHAGDGKLHRAFSVFLFDAQQRVLLHRRSAEKPLWPGFWTNSCCSHPRRGERVADAVHRRLREELGIAAARVRHVYSFEYQARFGALGSEHEFCHVYLAQLAAGEVPRTHAAEVMEWGWYSVEEVDDLQLDRPEALTPWFRMEWRALRERHAGALEAFTFPVKGPRTAA